MRSRSFAPTRAVISALIRSQTCMRISRPIIWMIHRPQAPTWCTMEATLSICRQQQASSLEWTLTRSAVSTSHRCRQLREAVSSMCLRCMYPAAASSRLIVAPKLAALMRNNLKNATKRSSRKTMANYLRYIKRKANKTSCKDSCP